MSEHLTIYACHRHEPPVLLVAQDGFCGICGNELEPERWCRKGRHPAAAEGADALAAEDQADILRQLVVRYRPMLFAAAHKVSTVENDLALAEAVIAELERKLDELGGWPGVGRLSQGDPPDAKEVPHGERDPDHEVGVIYQSTLYQGRWWWDRYARRHEIGRMPRDYLLNLMGFLERRAAGFYDSEVEIAQLALRLGLPNPCVELAEAESPLDWLRRTPLMRALSEAAMTQITEEAGTEDDDDGADEAGKLDGD